MAKVVLYNNEGKTAGELELDAALFEVPANPALVHEAVVAQQANSREVLAHAKDRSEVRGGGRKPWKQKGTGRARHGSRRSPIWSGGGVTFGPLKTRNFSKKMNRKARRKALAMVLSDKVASECFVAVDQFDITDNKTKALVALLQKLPVAGKKTLIVLKPENVGAALAAQNIQNISTIPANSLNIVDLLAHEYVLVSKEAVDVIHETYKR
jgi:large subunit ribosomal protein L4